MLDEVNEVMGRLQIETNFLKTSLWGGYKYMKMCTKMVHMAHITQSGAQSGAQS